jgi:hypothetical protein
MMNLLEFFDTVMDAPTPEARAEVLARRARQPKPRAEMPVQYPNRPRTSIWELRPRHLEWVDFFGSAKDYDRNALHADFMKNYNRLFGKLRRVEVPSDQLRKEFIIGKLLALIETRRLEYAEERAGLRRTSNIGGMKIIPRSHLAEYRERAKARAAEVGNAPNYIDRI